MKLRSESIYARAHKLYTLLVCGWRRASCGCCWIPPWEESDRIVGDWDEDEALECVAALALVP